MNHPLRPFAMTPNVAFRREVFQQIGLFDTRYPGGGWEDADLCWRFSRGTSLKLEYAPKAVVFHRFRTTARDFFVQHLRYGYGLALIYRKYRGELLWGWRQRLEAYRDLSTAALTLAAAVLRCGLSNREAMELGTAYFDFLRQLGQRIGFLRGAALSRRRLLDRVAHTSPGESQMRVWNHRV
jgi:GT2 family glycosyltransferase